jgi:YbbR domain-containing protein
MKDKLVSIGISLLIAFGLWMYVITEVSPNSEWTYYDIPVRMEGETVLRERNLIITAMSSTDVDLTLSGNRSDLNQLNNSNITLKADLTKIYDPGTHNIGYDIIFPGHVAANAFNRENQYPDSITITAERLIRNKEIPVNIAYQGKSAEGYVVRRGDAVLDNTHILVTGPQSVVDQITQAVIVVDLEGKTESISQNYRFSLCDSEGEGVDSELITVNMEEVHLDLTIHRKKQVDFTVTIVPGGGATEADVELKMSVESIQLSGSDIALEQVGDTINLGTINLADYENDVSLTFTIPTYEGLTNDSGETEVVVDISFKGLSTREIVIDEFVISGVPEGYEGKVITEKLTIKVRGKTELLSKLTAKDIIARVDFTNEEPGDATIRVNITFPGKYKTLGVLGKPTVTTSLQIMEKEE